jgi:hypothetical protein
MPRVAFRHMDYFFRRAFSDDPAATRTAFRPKVNNPVRRFDDIEVVLDDDDRARKSGPFAAHFFELRRPQQ